MCDVDQVALGEFGVYDLKVDEGGENGCSFHEALQPVGTSWALLYSFLVMLCIALMFKLVKVVHGRHRSATLAKVCSKIRVGLGFKV